MLGRSCLPVGAGPSLRHVLGGESSSFWPNIFGAAPRQAAQYVGLSEEAARRLAEEEAVPLVRVVRLGQPILRADGRAGRLNLLISSDGVVAAAFF